MQTYFAFIFPEHSQRLAFFGEQALYRKGAGGFWEFDPDLVTEAAFSSLVSAEMPNCFVTGVRDHFRLRKEALLLSRVPDKGNRGSSNFFLREEVLAKLEKMSRRKNVLAQVLHMMPTLEFALNSEQQQIMDGADNLFILGRSGTGKTTSTVLRFFC